MIELGEPGLDAFVKAAGRDPSGSPTVGIDKSNCCM